jgi:hypothetical protein
LEGEVYGGGDEAVDVASEAGDFLDDAGAEEGVGIFGHHEERFDTLVEFAVHEGELEFELEVGDCAEASKDGLTALLFDVIDEESGEGIDFDFFEVGDGLGDEVFAFFEGEEGVFGFIFCDGDDDAIEEFYGAFDEIEVAVGEGIETTWVDDQFHVLGF